MSYAAEIELLIEPLKHSDPRTWQALQNLNRQLEILLEDIEPIIRQSQLPTGGVAAVDPPAQFTCLSTGLTLRFTWSGVPNVVQYEVRKGTDWTSAFFQFRTTNLTADVDPLPYGEHHYLIKSMDAAGSYSILSSSTQFLVTQIPAPIISSAVIDNNVLLTWTIPASQFNIKHFIIDKEGTPIGLSTGTFATFFETLAGTYTYGITPVDIAGNVGARASTAVTVNQPPDFALQDRRTSSLNGTRVNVLKLGGPRLLCTWQAETWQAHFTTRSWMDPKDQMDAGYPIYIQPSATFGSYEEIIDYEAIISNLIVNVIFNLNQLTSSTMNVVVKMAVSEDGVNYTPFTSGSSQFFQSFRYLKLRLEFIGEDLKALAELYNLVISIDVKRENDGGEILSLASDVGGTLVYFTKPFKDVESITTTVKSTTEPFTAIFIFIDIPSPTFFHVLAYDSSGNRVTKTIDWKARGIV